MIGSFAVPLVGVIAENYFNYHIDEDNVLDPRCRTHQGLAPLPPSRAPPLRRQPLVPVRARPVVRSVSIEA